MDKKIVKAAVGNLRKELRAHGGKAMFAPKPAPKPPVDGEPPEDPDEEIDEEKKGKRQ